MLENDDLVANLIVDIITLRQLGLTKEEVEGYLEFFQIGMYAKEGEEI